MDLLSYLILSHYLNQNIHLLLTLYVKFYWSQKSHGKENSFLPVSKDTLYINKELNFYSKIVHVKK